jgi:hypothetical protein
MALGLGVALLEVTVWQSAAGRPSVSTNIVLSVVSPVTPMPTAVILQEAAVTRFAQVIFHAL